ncbi:CapA family protein [bacterium]|nr:CapA family protein [bacterium]
MIRLLGDLWAIDPRRSQINVSFAGLGEADLYFANLETPIYADQANCRAKAGPHIKGKFETLVSVCDPGERYCLALANNHMMDFEEIGLNATLEACQLLGAKTFGAGVNIQAAQSPIILEYDTMRIGILARCETQFGVAEPDKPGVAALDPTVYDQLRKLKAVTDVVIISVHGGAEMCPWPSPRRQATFRSFVDAGADIVHGHHSHIPQGYEIYNESLICYGLGNFLVDPKAWQEIPNSRWSIVIDFDPFSKTSSITSASIDEDNGTIAVTARPHNSHPERQSYIEKCNAPLKNRKMLTAVWQEVSIRMYQGYYADWLGFSKRQTSPHQYARSKLKRLRRLVRRSTTWSVDPKTYQLLLRYHLFACESHSEAIATALGVLGGELEDVRTPELSALVDTLMPSSQGGP